MLIGVEQFVLNVFYPFSSLIVSSFIRMTNYNHILFHLIFIKCM